MVVKYLIDGVKRYALMRDGFTGRIKQERGRGMRELKFRLIRRGEIVGYEKWSVVDGCWTFSIDGISYGFLPISHDTKEQYTGIADWFSGDILDLVDNPEGEEAKIIIVWDDRFVRFGYKYANGENSEYAPYPIERYALDAYHKISNIHENPELIKEQTR